MALTKQSEGEETLRQDRGGLEGVRAPCRTLSLAKSSAVEIGVVKSPGKYELGI